MGRIRGLARAVAAGYTKSPAALACDVIADHPAGPRPHARARRMTTKWVNVEAIGSYFESLSDPRHTRNRKHLLLDVVSAWDSDEGVALGEVATEAKSNEITAIPRLLKQIELAGAVVTIDAAGCQKEIARDIVAGGGDFVIAVKDNQPRLRTAIA